MSITFAQPAAAHARPPVDGIAGQITAHVLATIKDAAKNAPRSLQAAPGPSELGTPCMRRLAYKILDWPRANDDLDQWLATIGTAVHAWMADTFRAENRKLAGTAAHDRYLIEHRVHLPGGISGSADLYDRDTQTVIDWKVTSPDQAAKYARNGPGDTYRRQAHLYGLGMLLAGEQPQHVANVYLPRGGLLGNGMRVWTQPFNPALAVETLRRYEQTRAAVITLDPEARPAMWEMFPTADAHCTWCPYHLPMSADLSKGCPGHRSTTSKG